MNRISSVATLVLVALAGCGDEKAPAGAATGAKAADASAKSAPDAGKPDDDAKAAAGRAKAKTDWGAQIGDIPFSADWKTAMAQARASNKPLMFLFTEKASADGAAMGKGAFKDPKIVAAAAGFVPAVVDVDVDEPLAEQYGARTAPMVVYVSPKGEILGSTIAASDLAADMAAALVAMKPAAGK